MITRRSFITGLLAAPVIVQASNIWVPPRRLVAPKSSDLYRVIEIRPSQANPANFIYQLLHHHVLTGQVDRRSFRAAEVELESPVFVEPGDLLKLEVAAI